MKFYLVFFVVLVLAALDAAPVLAQVKAIQPTDPPREAEPDPNAVKVVELRLTPAGEPRPALKYELLPSPIERKPGNRATHYYRAMLLHQQVQANLPKEEWQKLNELEQTWTECPLNKLPQEEIRKHVAKYSAAIREIKTAAYREEGQFNLRLQDLRGMDTINFLLPDMQEMRGLARLLRYQTRLEIAEGKYSSAIETMRQGFQLGRDSAEPPLLITSLIGIAVATINAAEVEELIAAPGSPNLYWALATLPKPLIDMRPGMRIEMEMPARMFDFLNDAETIEMSAGEWHARMMKTMLEMQQLGAMTGGGQAEKPDWKSQLALAAMLIRVYGECKKALIESGESAEKVEKMPVGKVVAIQASRAYRQTYHEMFKWALLPYSDLPREEPDPLESLRKKGQGLGALSAADPLMIASLLLPAIKQARLAEVRLQKNLAALQTIEALRLYAATHEGKLPTALADITQVPVPINPTTGKPFAYELRGETATLDVPSVAANNGHRDARRYVIRLATQASGKK